MADAHAKNHDYHIVDPSPWPLIGGIGAFLMAVGGIAYMRSLNGEELNLLGANIAGPWIFYIGLAAVLYTMFGWWSDTIKEAPCGRSHQSCILALALWYDHVHCFRSDVFCRLVLGVFRCEPVC